jgi:hypothetical protein
MYSITLKNMQHRFLSLTLHTFEKEVSVLLLTGATCAVYLLE